MLLTPIVTQANGIISVVIQATFVGGQTDASDKQKIAAFGDPVVQIAGNFVDPNNPSFTFQFPLTQLLQGEASSATTMPVPPMPKPHSPGTPAASTCPIPHL